jgi:hypothetical protein
VFKSQVRELKNKSYNDIFFEQAHRRPCLNYRERCSGMNNEKISSAPVTTAGEDQALKIGSVEEMMSLGTPVGTWGGSNDILLRIRNWKPVAANRIGSAEENAAAGTLLGTFGGSKAVLLRTRSGTPVAANRIESVEEIEALGTPVGTWGGSKDILLRIRNGKAIAANVADQGGGQN